MNGKTIEELAQEHPEVMEVLTRFNMIKKAEPSLMDNIREAERIALEDISVCIKRCEATTGRSLYDQAQFLLATTFRPTRNPSMQVGEVIEVRSAEAEMPDLNGAMKPILQALGARAGQNKTQWSDCTTFKRWTQEVLGAAFNEARNTNAFK